MSEDRTREGGYEDIYIYSSCGGTQIIKDALGENHLSHFVYTPTSSWADPKLYQINIKTLQKQKNIWNYLKKTFNLKVRV